MMALLKNDTLKIKNHLKQQLTFSKKVYHRHNQNLSRSLVDLAVKRKCFLGTTLSRAHCR